MLVRRSAQHRPLPDAHVVTATRLADGRRRLDLDARAAHHPRGLGVMAGVADVVVGDVLEVAGDGVEPKAPVAVGVAPTDAAGRREPPTGRRQRHELVAEGSVGHGPGRYALPGHPMVGAAPTAATTSAGSSVTTISSAYSRLPARRRRSGTAGRRSVHSSTPKNTIGRAAPPSA